MTAQQIVNKFDLTQHPEGGYFKETYRSNGIIKNENLSENFIGDRNHSTGIYFLLTSDSFSAFHKINQDEMWHFYLGTTLKLHMISPEGEYSFVLIGNDILNNEVPQFVVPAQYWFAAEVVNENSFSFTGCTVAPGFDFNDFVLPERKVLIELFPQHKEIITRLTHH
ncbi:cupin domain-containing protein [uncultured Tenacibaculum sp.]|uniref:cupin domain-containing protein n=1 Tax=uncultured Tenacibaculum sp. TaxID=174713 RepID=UPI0026103CE4|nr:cupin domain-containing protein [uncultured Tenacibaculum sp.]